MSVEQVNASEINNVGRAETGENANRILDFLDNYGNRRVNSRIIDERRCIPPQVVLELAEAGLFGLQIEEKYGGQGVSYSELFRIMEKMSAIDTNIALLVGVQNTIGIPPIRLYASQEKKDIALPELASGRALATIAASEPGAGSNLKGLKSEAVRQSDGSFILNGNKSWISLGSWAKYINVFTMTRDEQGNQLGLTGFLVEQNMEGWIPGEEALTFGMKGLPQNHIAIKNLHLESSSVLGVAGGGKEAAEEAFMLGRSDIGANAVGTMKRCLQLISRYAKRRSIATGKLFDNGYTHQILTDCTAACRATEKFTMHIGRQLDRKEHVPDEIHIICKVISSELSWKVVDRSVQMLGARGFLDTNIVGQLHRDNRLLRIFEGPTEAMFLFLGQGILKNEHGFLQMVSEQYGLSDVIGRMEDIFESFRNRFMRADIELGRSANYHTHSAAIGQIACWGVLAAVVKNNTEGTDTRFDEYVALWASRKLDQVISETRSEFRPKAELPSSEMLSSQIGSYADTIGVIEQSLPGEARELDPWVRIDYSSNA